MPPMPAARPARTAGALLAGVLGLAPLAACSFTSHNVSCSTSSCTVTLSGDGAEADLLGTTLAFAGTKDGRASLSVGNASVSCAQGEKATAGPLSIECTSVTDNSVKLTASLR